MSAIGVMTMPANFRYRDVFLKGKPRHDICDPFRIRHPVMDTRHRAKIFSPFDAMKGFGDAVAAKDILYEERPELAPEDSAELRRRLTVLHDLTYNGRMARANRVEISVTYFESCQDEDHGAFGQRGSYRTVTGICYSVDTEIEQTITIDRIRIPLDDVLKIEAAGDVFEKDWDDPWLE